MDGLKEAKADLFVDMWGRRKDVGDGAVEAFGYGLSVEDACVRLKLNEISGRREVWWRSRAVDTGKGMKL